MVHAQPNPDESISDLLTSLSVPPLAMEFLHCFGSDSLLCMSDSVFDPSSRNPQLTLASVINIFITSEKKSRERVHLRFCLIQQLTDSCPLSSLSSATVMSQTYPHTAFFMVMRWLQQLQPSRLNRIVPMSPPPAPLLSLLPLLFWSLLLLQNISNI